MSTNVELIRGYYDHFSNHGEPPWDLHAPAMEFDPRDVINDLDVLRGKEAAEAALRSYAETFEEFHIELEEVVAADERQVVTTVRDGGRMKGSGAMIENRFHHVWTIENGRIVRWSSHLTKDQALQAAGLAP